MTAMYIPVEWADSYAAPRVVYETDPQPCSLCNLSASLFLRFNSSEGSTQERICLPCAREAVQLLEHVKEQYST